MYRVRNTTNKVNGFPCAYIFRWITISNFSFSCAARRLEAGQLLIHVSKYIALIRIKQA